MYQRSSIIAVAILAFFTICVGSAAHAQANRAAPVNPPVVTAAIVPAYSQLAQTAHISGEVSITVKIDSRGSVSRIEKVTGHRFLTSFSKAAALKWKFEPSTVNQEERRAELVFVFRQMPENTAQDDLDTVFMPPYRIEITRAAPKLTTND